MKWILGIVAFLVLAAIVVLVIGISLPLAHVASRTVSFKQQPDAIWRAITDYSGQRRWRDLKGIEILPDKGGHAFVRETDKRGDTITYETVESVPFQKLVRRIADKGLPFGGTWTFEIKSSGQGSLLTITENGEVYNPIFRFVSRFIVGHTASIDQYLKSLQVFVGE